MNEYICKYCGKVCKNSNSLRNHERLCKSNPNRQILKNGFEEYNQLIKKGLAKRKPSNQFIKAKELGIDLPAVSEETRLKISKCSRLRRHTAEEKRHLSEVMTRIARENPDKYSMSQIHKRTKHFTYKGYRIDGTWELIFAKYLDSKNIQWKKCKISFNYNWNESTHLYYPDFYLPEYDRYVEVKGYETERDRAKYKAIPDLIIIRMKEIKLIKEHRFDIIEFLNDDR